MSVREQTMKRLCRIRTMRMAVGGPSDEECRDMGYERKAAETAGTKEEGETREAVAGMGVQVTTSMANLAKDPASYMRGYPCEFCRSPGGISRRCCVLSLNLAPAPTVVLFEVVMKASRNWSNEQFVENFGCPSDRIEFITMPPTSLNCEPDLPSADGENGSGDDPASWSTFCQGERLELLNTSSTAPCARLWCFWVDWYQLR
jgi:hypothetical protein